MADEVDVAGAAGGDDLGGEGVDAEAGLDLAAEEDRAEDDEQHGVGAPRAVGVAAHQAGLLELVEPRVDDVDELVEEAVAGAVGARMLSRSLSTLLFEVESTDTPTHLAVAAFLALVALVAAALPAIRACRVDPVLAMRVD